MTIAIDHENEEILANDLQVLERMIDIFTVPDGRIVINSNEAPRYRNWLVKQYNLTKALHKAIKDKLPSH